jgi:hypothetical protein
MVCKLGVSLSAGSANIEIYYQILSAYVSMCLCGRQTF